MSKILCTKCFSSKIAKKGYRYNQNGKKQKYQCTICKTWFIFDDGFMRMRKPKESIVKSIHQINDGLSFSKVQNHLRQHDNVSVSRPGILYWVRKYSNDIKKTSSHS